MAASRDIGPEMGLKTVAAFLGIAFGVGWGVLAILLLFPQRMEAIFGPMGYTNPLFILVVYTPGMAGLFLVWLHHGWPGLGRYLRRLTFWRMPLGWWALLVVGMPAVFYAGALVKGEPFDLFPFSPWHAVLPALATGMVIGPMEEFGWRGLALPLLQRRFAPLWASLLLGLAWATWHLPAFFLSGSPQSAWPFAPYFIGVLAITVILTPMFNAARGSILIAAIFHYQMNGPLWPDAQPWDSIIFAAVAVVLVLTNRRAMLTREEAVTDVLPPATADAAGSTKASVAYTGAA